MCYVDNLKGDRQGHVNTRNLAKLCASCIMEQKRATQPAGERCDHYTFIDECPRKIRRRLLSRIIHKSVRALGPIAAWYLNGRCLRLHSNVEEEKLSKCFRLAHESSVVMWSTSSDCQRCYRYTVPTYRSVGMFLSENYDTYSVFQKAVTR